MSKGNNWIALDKNLVQEFKSIKRKFSMIEAMYSYSFDENCCKKGTISGYSKQWGWSRNKVRRFIKGIRTAEGHQKDSKRTHQGHPIHFIDNTLMFKKDSRGTAEGQQRDSQEDTTNKPKLNPKPKSKKKDIKKKFIRPPKEEVQQYFYDNGYTKEYGLTAWNFYDAGDWKDSNGKQVLAWKQKMRFWFKDEHKIQKTVYWGDPKTDAEIEKLKKDALL